MPKKKARIQRKVIRTLQQARTPEDVAEVVKVATEFAEKKVAEAPTERLPGATIAGAKVPYSYGDLCRMFPIVSFTPEETVPLIYQGVLVQAYAGVQMHVPACFQTIYERHRDEVRKAGRPKVPGLEIWPGAGSLE